MSDAALEISEDYDHDYTEPGDAGDPLKVLDEQVLIGEELTAELEQLMDATATIELFGMTPSAFHGMKTSNLLSGTALESLGLEHFAGITAEDPETHMASEALADKIKEKAAAWSAKVISLVQTGTSKILEVLTGLKDKIFAKGKELTEKAWDNVKSGANTIKAHPFKTVAAVIAAAAVVAGVVLICASPGAYANENALQSMIYKAQDLINKIKWPFGGIKAGVVEGKFTDVTHKTFKLTCQIENASTSTPTDTMSKLGWTTSAVKSILSQLNGLWTRIKSGVSTMAAPIISGVKKVDAIGGDMKDKVGAKVAEKTGSKLAGWAANKWVERMYMTALFSIIGVVTKLLRAVVVKAFQIVSETFNRLKAEPQTA